MLSLNLSNHRQNKRVGTNQTCIRWLCPTNENVSMTPRAFEKKKYQSRQPVVTRSVPFGDSLSQRNGLSISCLAYRSVRGSGEHVGQVTHNFEVIFRKLMTVLQNVETFDNRSAELRAQSEQRTHIPSPSSRPPKDEDDSDFIFPWHRRLHSDATFRDPQMKPESRYSSSSSSS